MQTVCIGFLQLVTSESSLVPRPPLLLLFWPGNEAKVRLARRHFCVGKKSAVWLPLDHMVALRRYLALLIQNPCLSHTRIMIIGCERPAIMLSSPAQRQSRTPWGHT